MKAHIEPRSFSVAHILTELMSFPSTVSGSLDITDSVVEHIGKRHSEGARGATQFLRRHMEPHNLCIAHIEQRMEPHSLCVTHMEQSMEPHNLRVAHSSWIHCWNPWFASYNFWIFE